MKVPIDDYASIDLDAPTLPAQEVAIDGITRFRVWCKYCRSWHYHSPYWRSGYNLALALENE